MAGEDLQELRELVEFLKASGIAEFDMERTDLKIRLKFAGLQPAAAAAPAALDLSQLASAIAAQSAAPAPVAAIPQTLPGAVPVVQAAAAAPAAEAGPEEGAHIVKSPIVGTFYESPSPDADPFVKVGDRVSTGQVLCIVEAMKLMNEIESDFAGEIVKVFVTTGQPVEYGQPLFAIK
jgi:acetyl-CoA carboxylase biotin carboxyl carrier protein